MACASKKRQSESLVEAFNDLNLFGKCNVEDLVFSNHENRAKEKIFLRAQKDRERELKRQEKLRKQQEKEDMDFVMNETRRRNGSHKSERAIYVPPQRSRGRGTVLSWELNAEVGNEKVRGRGRLSPEEKQCLPLYERSMKIKMNIDQFTDSSLHNNKVQQTYWTGGNQEEEDRNDIADYYNCSTTTSSSTPDQFEDAFDSPQSDSPQSFCSVPSRASGSPATLSWPRLEPVASNDPPLQHRPRMEASSSTSPRKPRGSRLAAKFSNNFEDRENGETPPFNNNNNENKQPPTSGREEDDPFSVLGSSQPPLAPSGFRKGSRSTSGVLFKNLNSSHRVLSNTVLEPKELFYHDYANAKPSNEFILQEEDFPAL